MKGPAFRSYSAVVLYCHCPLMSLDLVRLENFRKALDQVTETIRAQEEEMCKKEGEFRQFVANK